MRRLVSIIAVILVAAALIAGVLVWHAHWSNGEIISAAQAQDYIKRCVVLSTFSKSNGQAGIVLQGEDEFIVRDMTRDQLDQAIAASNCTPATPTIDQ